MNTLFTRHCGYRDELAGVLAIKTFTMWSGRQGTNKKWPTNPTNHLVVQNGGVGTGRSGLSTVARRGKCHGRGPTWFLEDPWSLLSKTVQSNKGLDKYPNSYHKRQSEATTGNLSSEGRGNPCNLGRVR